jgi:hypothetical protein
VRTPLEVHLARARSLSVLCQGEVSKKQAGYACLVILIQSTAFLTHGRGVAEEGSKAAQVCSASDHSSTFHINCSSTFVSLFKVYGGFSLRNFLVLATVVFCLYLLISVKS